MNVYPDYFSRRTGLLVVLLAVSLLPGVSPAQESREKQQMMALAAAELSDNSPEQSAADRAALTEQLQREIADLQGLLKGELPQYASLPELFEINLADEAAIRNRVDSLRQRLAVEAAPVATEASAPVTSEPATVAPPTSGATPDKVTAEPASVTPPAKPAEPAKVETAVVDQLSLLRTERDRLRLAFLSLPVEQRNVLRERDRLSREGQALAAEEKISAAALEATEQARDTALAAASRASAGAERALATAEARQLTYLSELAALRQAWARDDKARLDQRRALLARYEVVDSGEVLSPKKADVLYDNLHEDLRTLRMEADKAIKGYSARSVIVPLEGAIDLENPAYAPYPDAVARVRQLQERIAVEMAELQQRESSKRFADTNELMHVLRTLQARRVALLPMLTPEHRDQMTSFTTEGFNRVTGEVAHVALMARWYPVQRSHEAQSFAAMLKNVFTAGRLGVELLALILALVALFFAYRHSFVWLGKLRGWLASHVRPVTFMMRVDRAMQLLIAVGHELIVLFAVYLVFDWFYQAADGMAEMATLRDLAYAYAWYLLILAFIHRGLLVAVSRYREVNPVLNEKILTSLRQVTRLILAFAVYLILAKSMLGRGALYGISQDAAIVGVILMGWRLIRDWRAEVTQAYLNLFPSGRLSDLVRASQGRSYGLLIATAAFVMVAARGIWTWLRDLLLSFEQTRKALAYIFRRQLERQQSKAQAETAEKSSLPEVLQTALSEDPATEDLCIDLYPELPGVMTTAHNLAHGKHGALIALTGERGAGKTSWLMALQRRLADSIPSTLHTIDQRVLAPDRVCLMLCEVLGVEATTDPALLIERAIQHPPQVVMLDLGQNLVLRTVGGLAGHEMFLRVAQATVSKVLWVIAYARWPFEFLQLTHPGRDVYDQIIYLSGWSEQQISDLIDTRMAKAGFTADYDQLRLNVPVVAVSNVTTMAPDGAIERVMDRYHRLIWDYADGNPRVALHFFRLSLEWTIGSNVRVRLFSMPSMNALEDFEVRTRFILACLVQHENLTLDEAAESLRFPVGDCARALQLLYLHGILVRGETGRYRVSCHWVGAVMRFLKRKKLLVV